MKTLWMARCAPHNLPRGLRLFSSVAASLILSLEPCLGAEHGSPREQAPFGTSSWRESCRVGPAPSRRIAAEFEPHEYLVISASELYGDFPDFFASLVQAASESIRIVGIVRNSDEKWQIREFLQLQNISPAAIRTVVMPHNTAWVRDYGPFVVLANELPTEIIDNRYDDPDRTDDDALPSQVSIHSELPIRRSGLHLDGGNLISNGHGLGIATKKLLEDNVFEGHTEIEINRTLRDCLGLERIVWLEPLDGELTGHVDMFACFVNPETILVGAYDSDSDPINAKILDTNATLLSQITGPSNRPLEVRRVPMPTVAEDVFRTHLNVIFANGTLLLPVYPDLKSDSGRVAAVRFGEALPGWKIIPVDATEIIQLGGSLHCISGLLPYGMYSRKNPPCEPQDF